MLGTKCPYAVSGASVNRFLQNVRRSTFPALYSCLAISTFYFQFPIIISQVYDRKLSTKQEVRYTTTAGTIFQLMGSDDQFSFPEFPCVLAYNRVNHYLPTCFLSDQSLTNWRSAQIYKHLEAANEFFHECRPVFVEKEPILAIEMETLFIAASEVYHKLRDRAKLGTTAASSVPIVLTGKKPTRSDVIGRWAKFPKKDCRLTGPQPQPEFSSPEENPALPQYLVHEQKKARQEIMVQGTQTEEVIILDEEPDKPATTATPAAPAAASSRAPALPSLPVSLPLHSTSADKPGTGSKSSPGSSQVKSSQPVVRPKRKAVKQSIMEEGQVDDEDRDPGYQPDVEEDPEDEPEEAEDQPGVSLSQAESISQGIPQLPKKRKIAKEENLKYPCKVCSRKFQRTSELRDHTYVVHLGQTFDCAECLKSYQTKKAYKNHEKLKHQGLGKIKCTQEGCDWADPDSGKLHNHLLTAHNIGEPIICNVVLENGKKCGKIFTNTRSFQTHAGFHMEKKYQCDQCDRHFSTEVRRKAHIHKYHPKSQSGEDKWQCDICGKVFDQESLLKNHKTLHMLKHHRELQAQKKLEAEEAPEGEEGGEGLEAETSATTDAESQPEPQASTSAGEVPLAGSSSAAEAPIGGSSSAAEAPIGGSSSAAEAPLIIGSAVITRKEGEEDADLEEVLSYL